MGKRIMHLFVVILIGICLSMPLAVSATAETGATDPAGAPTAQCTNTAQKSSTSTTLIEGEAQATDSQTEEPTDDCTDWQTAPVSWNS